MFKSLTNNLKSQAKSFKIFYSNSTKSQVSKTSASASNKLNERLSFLKSEEEMRNYFNIIDWEKKECEEVILRKFREEKEKYSQSRQDYQSFTRQELFNIAKRFQDKLKTTPNNNNDYNIPEEVFNYKKDNLKSVEIINEFSLDNIEFLKDKPKNCLLVSGFESAEDISSVLDLMRDQGEVIRHSIIPDLMGKASLVEIYFYTDNEAKKAKLNLHNYLFKNNSVLRVWSHNDAHRETQEDKTVVVTGLESNLKRQELLQMISNYGHIVKLEMPLVGLTNNNIDQKKKGNNNLDVFNTCDIYFNELEKNINGTAFNEQALTKNKLSIYLVQINKLIKEFKEKINRNNNSNNSHALLNEQSENQLNNLLVEIKFFMKKFFPNEIINSLILPELNNNSSQTASVNNINNSYKTNNNNAFNKILNNLENFLTKYEEKMERLSRPLTKDEIPIDLLEVDQANKKSSIFSDPEKLDKKLIFQAVDETNETEIKNEFSKINFYSTFLPLEEQVAKLNFIRSLSADEKQALKDKFDLSLSVNTPKFLDYFINFSRAVGLKIIDKYIDLSELYMSMTPLEKVYHGRKLSKKMKLETSQPRQEESEVRLSLFNFLEIRQLRTIKDVYHLNSMKRTLDSNFNTRFLDYEQDILMVDLQNMIGKNKLPNISMGEFITIMNKHSMFDQKVSYMQALVPMNLAKKRLYIEKIRARMVKYNEVFLEFVKNYKLLSPDHELRIKYDKDVNKLSELIFGKHDALNDVDMNLVYDENEDKGGFNLPDKNRMDYDVEQIEAEKRAKEKEHKLALASGGKKVEKKFNRTEYKYSGKELTENQIINRLDYVKSIRDKLINSVLRISNLKHYGSKRYNKINDLVQQKLVENVNTMFADNPKLHAHYLEKLNNKINKLKYCGLDFAEKQYKLEEIVEDIVQKEIDYVRKSQFARSYVENLEQLIDDKVSKGNLVKALSVYDSFNQIHEKYTDYGYLKSKSRAYLGSPIKVFFTQVKIIFEQEMRKVEIVKEIKLTEMAKDENKSLDEVFNKRKELIEDYTNKIVNYQNAVVNDEVINELEKYKLKKLGNIESGSSVLLDEDDSQYEVYNIYMNELKKKEFEIKQNKIKYGVEHEDEYKDVTSLISNFNKLQKNNNSSNQNVSNTYEKIFSALNSKKPVNKGYAFITFATSDEAKQFFLVSQAGMKLGKSKVKVEPKFDSTHENYDEQYMLKRAKADGNILNKRDELVQAESKLKEFEANFYKNLEKNDKLNEFSSVREAFKDLYSDPFKKHDRNNPMTKEEEEEAKYRMKLSGETETTWLFEDENLEKMRMSRDKRIVKKYTQGQLIKKGIINAEILNKTSSSKSSSLVGTKYEIVQPMTDSYFNSSNEFEPISSCKTNYASGRRFTPLGTSEFIENYLGQDYLENTVPAFEKDKREASVYNELKELRERFPKEKFTKDPKETENLINEVNSKFIRLLKHEDSTKSNENAKEEILDKITNITPLGKQLQTIINHRNDKVQEEETRQMITLQHFYEKRIEKHAFRNRLINEIPEDRIDMTAFNQLAYASSENKDLYRTSYIEPPLQEVVYQRREGEEEREDKKFQPGDTSFEAFLHRRRDHIDADNDKDKDKAPADEKDKTQFDENNISGDMIRKVKEESMNEVMESIKTKYEKHLGVFDKFGRDNRDNVSSSKLVNKESLYGYIKTQNEREINNKIKKSEEENFKKIQIEKLKLKFLEELEKNFSEELETLPSFKQYFLNIKYGDGSNPIKEKTSNTSSDLFNFSSTIKLDRKREEMALLMNGKITPSSFKKTFVHNQIEKEEKFNKWLTEKDQKDFINQSLIKMGIDQNDPEAIENLKAASPHFFDESLAKEHIENQLQMTENLEEINNLEDQGESEYYFNPDSHETLEEHLAGLSKLKNSKVILRKDADGRVVIRREFKNNYKYDLDELMNFDMNKEREKMMKKIENFNFKSEIISNVDYYVNFYQLCKSENIAFKNFTSNNLTPEEFSLKVSKIISKIEDYIRISYNMDNFYFDDFKRLVDNLLTLNAKSLTNFISSVTKLIRLVRQESTEKNISSSSEEITEVLKNISEFSKDIFNEREVRIFVELMKNVLISLGDRKITELDNFSKFIFIQNVLLKDILGNLSSYLNSEEMIYVYGILKLLPNKIPSNLNYNEESDLKKRFKILLWNKYKNHMLQEFTIVLKKEKEIKPHIALEATVEQKIVLSSLVSVNIGTEKEVDKEIEEFSKKLKEYYVELTKANTSEYDLSSIVTDEELFIEEITEQIQNRLKRLKTGREITKEDLVKRKYNEENLYKKQLEYVHKVGKRYEAMAFRDDVGENEEMLNEVKEALTKNAIRKKKLLDEGKPEIDFDYPRLI